MPRKTQKLTIEQINEILSDQETPETRQALKSFLLAEKDRRETAGKNGGRTRIVEDRAAANREYQRRFQYKRKQAYFAGDSVLPPEQPFSDLLAANPSVEETANFLIEGEGKAEAIKTLDGVIGELKTQPFNGDLINFLESVKSFTKKEEKQKWKSWGKGNDATFSLIDPPKGFAVFVQFGENSKRKRGWLHLIRHIETDQVWNSEKIYISPASAKQNCLSVIPRQIETIKAEIKKGKTK